MSFRSAIVSSNDRIGKVDGFGSGPPASNRPTSAAMTVPPTRLAGSSAAKCVTAAAAVAAWAPAAAGVSSRCTVRAYSTLSMPELSATVPTNGMRATGVTM